MKSQSERPKPEEKSIPCPPENKAVMFPPEVKRETRVNGQLIRHRPIRTTPRR